MYSRRLPPEYHGEFDEALKVEGLSQEIALLRVLVERGLAENWSADDLTKAIGLLTRAVATQHRMSPKATDDLANALAAALEHIGGQLAEP